MLVLEKDFTQSLSGSHNLSVSSLSLSNFRNYSYARIEVAPQPVVLVGENGSGKTNILEAISLLGVGRGLRRAKLSELDNVSSPAFAWAVAAGLNGKQGDVRIGTGRDGESYEENDKRIVKIDGKICKSQAELANHISLIWLTPQMEQLFSEGATAGRKFLDRLVYSFDAAHATRINEYDYAMRERNKLLAMNRADNYWLDTLEAKMAAAASAIAIARLETCEHINHTIHSSPLSFPKALVDVAGVAEDALKSGVKATAVELLLREAFAAGRGQDAAAGRTLTGTHRSELKVTHILKNMQAAHCSMGEQKAMLLSIVLAQARAGARWHGVTPILLLDEVAGHLDAVKRLELFAEICDTRAQVWMTGTEAHLFAGITGNAQFFTVQHGKIDSYNGCG